MVDYAGYIRRGTNWPRFTLLIDVEVIKLVELCIEGVDACTPDMCSMYIYGRIWVHTSGYASCRSTSDGGVSIASSRGGREDKSIFPVLSST